GVVSGDATTSNLDVNLKSSSLQLLSNSNFVDSQSTGDVAAVQLSTGLEADVEDQSDASLATQIFFLETNGALDVDYSGPGMVEDIDVPGFLAPAALAGQETEALQAMTAALNSAHFDVDVLFTMDRPEA